MIHIRFYPRSQEGMLDVQHSVVGRALDLACQQLPKSQVTAEIMTHRTVPCVLATITWHAEPREAGRSGAGEGTGGRGSPA